MTPEIQRFIVKEIERRLNIITSGTAGETTQTSEVIDSLFAGMPSTSPRPVSQPYGFVSRAKRGTISVTAQQGAHPGNKLVLGHRDPNAPTVDEGESAIYSSTGYKIVTKNGEIFVGKGDVVEHVVVGETLKTALSAIIEAIVAHTHQVPALAIVGGGNTVAAPTGVPLNASDFSSINSSNFTNNKILAKDGGRF